MNYEQKIKSFCAMVPCTRFFWSIEHHVPTQRTPDTACKYKPLIPVLWVAAQLQTRSPS